MAEPKPQAGRLKDSIEQIKDARRRHHERHQATGLGFAFADSIHYLDKSAWDHVAQNRSFFLQRRYLEVLEANCPDNLQPRYGLIFNEIRPLAAIVLQVLDLRAADLNQMKEGESLSDRARSTAMKGIKARVLMCGNCLSWGQHAVAFADDVDREQVWRGVAEALYRVRRAEKLAGQVTLVMVKDLPIDGSEGEEVLSRISYRPLETEPDMVLSLPAEWQSHDDYLAALSSKYRKPIKKIFKDVDAAGCDVVRIQDLRHVADRLHELYLNVHAGARVRLVTMHKHYLPALSEAAGEDFRCTAIRRGDDILGFVTTIRDGDTAVGYYLGYEKSTSTEIPLYLRLLHAVVADAIDLKCRRLSLGRTALEPKARLGGQPMPLRTWQRHRNPVVNFLTRELLKTVSHDEAPDRKPFK